MKKTIPCRKNTMLILFGDFLFGKGCTDVPCFTCLASRKYTEPLGRSKHIS